MEEIFGTSDDSNDFIIGVKNHLHHSSPLDKKNDSFSSLNSQNYSIGVNNEEITKSYSEMSFESSSNPSETFSPQVLSEDIFGDDIDNDIQFKFDDKSHNDDSNNQSSLMIHHFNDEKKEQEDLSNTTNLIVNSQSGDSDSMTKEVLHEINLDDDDDDDVTDQSTHFDNDNQNNDKKPSLFNMITGIKIPFMKSPSTSDVSSNETKNDSYKNQRILYLESELSKSKNEIQELKKKLDDLMKQNANIYELQSLKDEVERKDKLLLEANNNSKKWKQKYEDTFLMYESVLEECTKLKEELNQLKRSNGIINEEFDFNKRLKEMKQRYEDDLERIKIRYQNEIEKEKKMNALDKNHNKQLIDKIKERAQKDIEFLQSQIESQNKIIEKLLVDNSELMDINALTRRIQMEAKVPGSLGAIVKENEMLEKMIEDLEKKNELLLKENENMKKKLSIESNRDDEDWKISSQLITPITSTTNTPAPTPTQLFKA